MSTVKSGYEVPPELLTNTWLCLSNATPAVTPARPLHRYGKNIKLTAVPLPEQGQPHSSTRASKHSMPPRFCSQWGNAGTLLGTERCSPFPRSVEPNETCSLPAVAVRMAQGISVAHRHKRPTKTCWEGNGQAGFIRLLSSSSVSRDSENTCWVYTTRQTSHILNNQNPG